MKDVVCKSCGSHELYKENGYLVCKYCGTRYLNEARFSNIFIEKRASSCPQSLEKSRFFSYPPLMSEGENSQNVKRIFLRKVVI